MHRVLERQLKRYVGVRAASAPEWRSFLAAVDKTYQDYDEDRRLLNRSFEISSKEYRDNSRRLQDARATIEKQAKGLAAQVAERTRDLGARVAELEEARKSTADLLEQVKQNEERYRNLVDVMSEGLGVQDAKGNISFMNKRACEMLGYELKELVGKPIRFVFDDENWKIVLEQMKRRRKGERKSYEVAWLRKDGGKIPTIISPTPIFDKKGDLIQSVAVFTDIAERKQAEMKLLEIDRAKTEFVSLASHQLRTPLTAINWYAEMLLAGDAGKLNQRQKKYLNEVYKGNRRMVELVTALLNVSRLELGTFVIEPEPTDIVKLALSVVKEQRPLIAAKKISFSCSCAKNVPRIPADPKLLRMVLQNIVANAVKYTPAKGRIVLSISSSDKDGILVKVSDTGYGIPKDQQRKIFTKLFRADNVRNKDVGGTGLGLYIAKSIIDGCGGKIWFESEENKGSTFFVTLPQRGMRRKAGTKSLSA